MKKTYKYRRSLASAGWHTHKVIYSKDNWTVAHCETQTMAKRIVALLNKDVELKKRAKG
jgi:hypothetical protein